jgi:pyruvate dehydrogenase complex dehydrogenase (E1) component
MPITWVSLLNGFVISASRCLICEISPDPEPGHDDPGLPGALRTVFPDRAPTVTVHDAASHTMSWLGSALGVPAVSLGVDSFGQSGAVSDLYRAHDLDAGSIVNAALAALSLR